MALQDMTTPATPNMEPTESNIQMNDPQSLAEAYGASFAEVLQRNLGVYVRCEFLIGTQGLVSKEGILYTAGINYLTLYNPAEDNYTVCDLYSVKFVTLYDPNSPNVPYSAYQGPAGGRLPGGQNNSSSGRMPQGGMLPNNGMAPNGGRMR